MLHKIKLKNIEGSLASKLFIDDKDMSRASGIEFEQFAGEVPTAIVHLAGFLDIDTVANVMYVANEEGVEKATKYLRESIEKDEALRDEFKSRILSAIDGNTDCFESEKLANKILDVIFRD